MVGAPGKLQLQLECGGGMVGCEIVELVGGGWGEGELRRSP